jgi:hypothetical protein
MPLGEPPVAAGSLADVPGRRLAGRTVYRVWRVLATDGTRRSHPWWFRSVPANPQEGGRFDLPDPMGTCYFGDTPVGAVIEGLQAFLRLVPTAELRARRLATVQVPDEVPPAADLTARALVGRHGVTAALWAGGDRALTQRWAAAFRRDGWWGLYGGMQHDPSGRLRGWAWFDHAGAHRPSAGGLWSYRSTVLSEVPGLAADLAGFGVVVRDPGELPEAIPPEI